MKQRVLFTVIMSFFLSSLMTLWVTYINLGYTPEFLDMWRNAFLLAWPAAGIISFIISPLALRITHKVLG
ncbi:DUF2798 domain-containing protein [Vibrio sp. DW001]|uniref:DUF2798 domain-containing protein n=1 Tax=Vibrio sp. DW001 TaxID=2912315 RepID=UPI0023B06A70|nr:DUF2798 domain-containing protein [Vibrio sp. DW001]WED25928.1 DUF2798 domain-containing protein [Vibrio sp. DW001]